MTTPTCHCKEADEHQPGALTEAHGGAHEVGELGDAQDAADETVRDTQVEHGHHVVHVDVPASGGSGMFGLWSVM
jgi:hypothetical protein